MLQRALENARRTWDRAKLRTARRTHRCDYIQDGGVHCEVMIRPGDGYIDPGEANPGRAGGFGGYRYHIGHFVETA